MSFKIRTILRYALLKFPLRGLGGFLFLLGFGGLSCTQQYVITSMKGEYVPVHAAARPDPKMTEMVDGYQKQLVVEMRPVVGYSAQYMEAGRPESLLTNFTSDVMFQYKPDEDSASTVDLALMNVGGHRAPLREGEITVGNVFEVYSFDNEMVIARLKGEYLIKIFEACASRGGEGVSSNVKLIIKDKQLVKAEINGLPVDPNKMYNIITVDYLTEGNDGMVAMNRAESVTGLGLFLRDYMLEYIAEKTKAGEQISSKTDGRIVVE